MPPSLPSIGLPSLPSLPGRGAAGTLMELRGQMRSELFRDVARGAGPQPGNRNAGPGSTPGPGPGAGAHPQAPGQHVAPAPGPAQSHAHGVAGTIGQGQIGQDVSAVATTADQTGSVVSHTVQSLLAQGRPPASQLTSQAQPSAGAQPRQATTPPVHLPGVNIPGARAAAGHVAGANAASPQALAGQTAASQVAAGLPGSGPGGPGQAVPGQMVGQATGQQAPAQLAQAGPLQAPPAAPHAGLAARADSAPPPAPAGQPLPATTSAVPVPATQAPAAPQGSPPARPDGAMIADRTALQPATTVPANPAASPASASTQAATSLAALSVPGNPQTANAGTNPLAQQAVPATQAGTEARGNTVMQGNERGPQRTDGPLPHGHTVEAGQRRPGLRGLGAAMLAAWGRPGGCDSDSAIHRQADYVFQWLYWALTITAWLCLGLLVVSAAPLFGPEDTTAAPSPVPLGMIAAFAGVGLCAALTAWLVSRVRGRD